MGCAQNTSKSMQMDEVYHPEKTVQTNKVNTTETKKNKIRVENYDKKVNRETTTKKEVSNESVSRTISDNSFTEISQQKLQQLFDISLLLDSKSTKDDMKDYARKHAKRLFIASRKVNIADQINSLHFPNADSLRITHIKLINMTEIDEARQLGRYKLLITPYKNGEKHMAVKKTAEIYFEIEELKIDDKVYRTIKGKIMKIE